MSFFADAGSLLHHIAHLGGTTLLAVLLICLMAGAAAKTTAFMLVKSLGKSRQMAARVSFYGMAFMFMFTFAVCLLATSRYAIELPLL